jgi:hypothetical protein
MIKKRNGAVSPSSPLTRRGKVMGQNHYFRDGVFLIQSIGHYAVWRTCVMILQIVPIIFIIHWNTQFGSQLSIAQFGILSCLSERNTREYPPIIGYLSSHVTRHLLF